jgi:MHS family citrate/tricarballylate:H+ symporter-like MFS transporter
LAHDVLSLEKSSMARAAFGATIGNMLEFYDFITYSFFAIQIGHTFFPAQSEYGSLMLSLATFGAGFVTRPIGGIVLGIYSDRVGRRPAMLLSFALMGAAILVLALTPSYNAIGLSAPMIAIAARMVQGFALGGEVRPRPICWRLRHPSIGRSRSHGNRRARKSRRPQAPWSVSS